MWGRLFGKTKKESDEIVKLEIELVPESAFYSNLRKVISTKGWNIVRRKAYQKANYHCEICGNQGLKHPCETHEQWAYENGIQKLVKISALCPSCHMVKHYGLTKMKGLEKKAFKHLMKINNWNEGRARKYVNKCFDIWRERSYKKWKIDTSYLKQYAIENNIGYDFDKDTELKQGRLL